ncbi:hypothetical protein [Erwinia pyrifoliae]|uniref:BRCT domain-containing protein n=1 Tax=Erwinia pyrifoliae TaxID=79967 RepID=A0ABY5XCY0_ERWPY|nr:hypothetical protein [Erwinia pyrifoliae]MCT2387323.1 hypothetical protein [Erwinia pyrifoliae]MCU8587077.1 hypothetical protein [Erwinia pyrifoliae]UWS30941.1 hypothetical protein NYP81_05645 [Erwinia pyrifoliae]UWS35261.1 hypothetical protein NYP84_09035 [Erwinia pyrifoliae]
MDKVYFVYETRKKNISAYTLSSHGLCGDYLQGYCENREQYRTFRLQQIIGFFDSYAAAVDYAQNFQSITFDYSLSTAGFDLSGQRKNYKKYESPGMYQPLDFSGALEICFTGFKKEERKILEYQALDAGMIVRRDVSVNLHLLCGGYNAGPKKLEVARKKGTMILREPEFIALITSGELPDDYDNQ